MFVCYLDDSGGDSENPITTLAGYVAMDAAWILFERNVEPVFKEFGVEVLHAVNLHNTKGDFKLWPRDKKEKFVSRVCEAMAPNALLGISVSVDKEIYQARREESRAKGMEKSSPYYYCFRVISDWLMEQAEICAVGVSFILEHGHGNNAEVEQGFQNVRQQQQTGGSSEVIILPCQTGLSCDSAGGLVCVLLAPASQVDRRTPTPNPRTRSDSGYPP